MEFDGKRVKSQKECGHVKNKMRTYAFRGSQFMSARDKGIVLKAWVRFLKHGLRWQDFGRRLYEHLHLHCSFIAHYNQRGFYDTYFEAGATTARFLSQFDKRGECRPIEYGSSLWRQGEYEDLADAMIEEGAAHIPTLIQKAEMRQRDHEFAEARRLASKHGFGLSSKPTPH